MRIVNCENPKYIINKHTKEYVLTSCGHCATCRNTKAGLKKQLLSAERSLHEFCAFAFLSYSPKNVVSLICYIDDDSIYFVRNDNFDCVFTYDITENFQINKSLEYVLKRDASGIPCYIAVKEHIQKFLKRLRYYCKTYYNEKIRYHIISEYGPTTFRPHYHGLFFFSSKRLAKDFREILLKSWKLGLSDFSFSKGERSLDYCSRYMFSTSNLPQVLKSEACRPFALSSKRTPLGFMSITRKEIYEAFNDGVVSVGRPNVKKGRIESVPLFRSVENWLFPKIQGFSRLSPVARTIIYGAVKQNDVEEYLENVILGSFDGLNKYKNEDAVILYKYLVTITKNFSVVVHSDLMSVGLLQRSDCYPLANFIRILKRVKSIIEYFGCSFDYYMSRMELYYSNKSLSTLRNYYALQVSYLEDGRRSSDVFYPKLLASQYGEENVGVALSDTLDFIDMVTTNNLIERRSSKVKSKNDYLEAHPELKLLNYNMY